MNNSCNKDVLGRRLLWTFTFNLGARYDFKKKNRNWGLFLNGPGENRPIKESRFKFAVFIMCTPRRFPPKFIENTFFKLSRVLLDLEMHSKRHYKICICSVNLGKIESFRNFEGFCIIFPKMSYAI